MDFSSRSIRPEGTFHQWGKDAAPEWGRSLGLSSKGEGCKTLLSFLLSIEHLFWSQLQTPERSPCTAQLRSQPFLGVLWIFTPGPGWLIPPPSFWFAKIQVVCEYLTITPVWKGVTKSQSQTSRAAALFVVEQADTGTVAVCFPPSGSFFPFTATVLCINDCEEINLLVKRFMRPAVTWVCLTLAASPRALSLLDKVIVLIAALALPGTTWFALNNTCFPSGVLFWCPQSWLCSVFQGFAGDAPRARFHTFLFPLGCVLDAGPRSFPAHTCTTCQMQSQLINCISCCSCLLTGDV